MLKKASLTVREPRIDLKPAGGEAKVIAVPNVTPSTAPTEHHVTAFDESAPVTPGFHPEAPVPTQVTHRRGDWLEGVAATGINANVDSRQAKALLDQAVADYHRDVTGGTMRTLNKDELLGLANHLTGHHSPLLDVLKQGFDDRSVYPGKPSVLLGADPDGPTVWFMGWRRNDQTSIHSHNETQGSVSVHRGHVREQTWNTETGELDLNRVFKRGEGAAIPTPYIHQVTNERDEMATTIHAYHPPLYMMEQYQLQDGKAVMTGRWEDDERVEWEARQAGKGAL